MPCFLNFDSYVGFMRTDTKHTNICGNQTLALTRGIIELNVTVTVLNKAEKEILFVTGGWICALKALV